MSDEIAAEVKKKALDEYLSGKKSASTLARELGKSRICIYRWRARYEERGIEGLQDKKGVRYIKENPRYSAEQKLTAVTAYLAGEGSQKVICQKYKIRSRHTLQSWLKVYNSGKEFKESHGGSRMSTLRKTTQDERVQIVKECLESGRDYGATALKYSVSYQQVFTWVKKFSELGEAGLEDRRGRRTGEQEPRTEAEAMKVRIAQLEHELYMTKMERDLLKKVKELERGEALGK